MCQDSNADQLGLKINWPSQLGLYNTLAAPLQRDKTPLMSLLIYDTKLSDGEAPVMLKHCHCPYIYSDLEW